MTDTPDAAAAPAPDPAIAALSFEAAMGELETIVRRLESLGETDVPSKVIGEIVMESLARIDTVAYVRFASVYKNFQAADDFDKFVSELRPTSAGDE